MDNTTFAYLFGAFILGFLVAWIAGRSGPNRAIKECEANSQDLQRKLKERDSAIAKAEAQLIERQAELDRLGGDKAKIAAALQAAEVQLATTGEETTDLQIRLRDNEGEVLRLRTELRHISDAWANASTRSAALGGQLEDADRSAAVMAVEAAEAIMEAEEAVAVAVADERSATAQIDELSAKLEVMTRELELTRAAAARAAAMVMMRPQLTPERREEYAALASDPDQVVQALHERDIVAADAVNESSYLRRSLGIMTAMGSELAGALEKRNREYDAVAHRLARVTLLAETAPPSPVKTPAAPKDPTPKAEVMTSADAAKAAVAAAIVTDKADDTNDVDAAFTELQRKIDEMQAQLVAAGAAQGDLESRLQAQGLSYDNLVTRLAEISAELESLQADEDAAPATTLEPEAEVAATPDADSLPSDPGDDTLKRLTAGVALALTAIQRKNARVSGLTAERDGLETGLAEKEQNLADLSTQLLMVQDDLNSRSVQYDALSLHASSLGVEVEQAQSERAQLDDQVRRLANELIALADQYAPMEAPAETPVEAVVETPAETPAEPVAATAAPAALSDAAVSAEAPVAEAPGAEAPDADAAPVIVADTQEDPTVLSGAALLAVAVARIRAAVAKQETDLAEASERLSTLGEQLDTVDNEEAALSATISDQESALADAGQQLATLQENLAMVTAERDDFLQRFDGYHVQLSDLLTQYAEAEPTTQLVAETVPASDAAEQDTAAESAPVTAIASAPAETPVLAPTEEMVAESEDAGVAAPTVDAVAAAIAAIGALFARKQVMLGATSARVADLEGQLGDLNNVKGELDTTLAEKEQALAGAAGSYASLQDEFGKRSAQFDALSMRASSLESDIEIARMERAKFESQIQAVADKLGAIATSYAEETPAPAAEPIEQPAADAAPAETPVADGEATPLPLAAQLETNAAAVSAIVANKVAALAAVQTEVAALQQDLATRSGDLEAVTARTAELETQLAAAETAKTELDSALTEISAKVQALRLEFDDEPVVEAETPATDSAAPVEAEPTVEVGPGAVLAGIAGIDVVLARRRQTLEESQARLAELEQQVADLTAQLQAAELDREQIQQNLEASGQQIEALTQQVADLQAQLDAATAERDGLRSSLDEIGSNLEALGAAADADNDEEEDRVVDNLVKAGVVAGGATALVSSRRHKRNALEEANVQVEQVQQQLTAATAAQAELEARNAAQRADFEAASSQAQALQAKLDALAAEKAGAEEAMQRQLEDAQTQLQARDSLLEGMRRQLDLEAEWQRKSPFLASLVQKLNKWSGVKSVAASAALEEQVVPKSVKLPENLTYVTHIGKTYADRLHAADVGTYWELAFMPDAELAQILKLNELQLMGMNFDEVRASARQLAVENGSVGHMWERVAYDDFEKIKGIGGKLEQRLYDAGVTTYAQLAGMTPEQLDEICQPKPPLRPKYDRWIDQAQALLAAHQQEEAAAASVAPPAEAAAAAEPPADAS